MGMLQSYLLKYSHPERNRTLDSLASQSVTEVLQALIVPPIEEKEELTAVCTLIIEKAITRPELMDAYVELIANLRDENFYQVLERVFEAKLENILKMFQHEHLRDERTMERGQAVATFTGKMFNLGVLRESFMKQFLKKVAARDEQRCAASRDVSLVSFVIVYHEITLTQSKNVQWKKLNVHELSIDKFVAVKEGNVWAYVARKKLGDDCLIVGKFVKECMKMFMPAYGKELEFSDDIEVLMSSGRHMWISYPGYIPNNAVVGGYEMSTKLFIGRKWHDDNKLLGKIVDGTGSVYCSYFGDELKFDNNFDILVEH